MHRVNNQRIGNFSLKIEELTVRRTLSFTSDIMNTVQRYQRDNTRQIQEIKLQQNKTEKR